MRDDANPIFIVFDLRVTRDVSRNLVLGGREFEAVAVLVHVDLGAFVDGSPVVVVALMVAQPTRETTFRRLVLDYAKKK